jgi:hypothetical protein
MSSSGMLRRVDLVRTDVSEERITSIMVTRIGALGSTLAVTSNPKYAAKEYVLPKRRFSEEPHGVTSHKPAFFKININLHTAELCISINQRYIQFSSLSQRVNHYILLNSCDVSPYTRPHACHGPAVSKHRARDCVQALNFFKIPDE